MPDDSSKSVRNKIETSDPESGKGFWIKESSLHDEHGQGYWFWICDNTDRHINDPAPENGHCKSCGKPGRMQFVRVN